MAFKAAGIDIEWQGIGLNEVGVDSRNGNEVVAIDSKYFRPAEVEYLLGDSSKARQELNWEPKVKLENGIQETIKWWKENIDEKTLKPKS
jgi:GDPmannose 4,6-dehydratase